MNEDVDGFTPYPDRQARVQFQHWVLFTNLFKQSQPAETNVDILCAVYYRPKNSLLLPGSTLAAARTKFNGPHQLSAFLRKNSPDLNLLPRDELAGAVACREILYSKSDWKDSVLLCTMDNPANVQRLPGLMAGRIGDPAPLGVTLKWPDDFRALVAGIFSHRPVHFSAFPLSVDSNGARLSVDHVALVYFYSAESGDGNAWGWFRWLRDLLLFGALTHLSEQLANQEQRLKRHTASEGTLGLNKINPPAQARDLIAQARRLEYLRTSTKQSRIIFPPVDVHEYANPPFYRMPKYDLLSLRRLLMAPTQPSEQDVTTIVSRLMDCLCMDLYLPTRKDAGKEENWTFNMATKRLHQRRAGMLLVLKKIKAEEPVALPSNVVIRKEQEAHRLLTKILDRTLSETVEVNDGAPDRPIYFIGPSDIVIENKSPQELKENLNVRSVCAIHGDLHFDNILVDAYFPEDPLFVLVDPRPRIGHGDPAFDVAKLLFSCDAGYDFIHRGNFDLNIVDRAPPDSRLIHMKIPDLDVVHVDIESGAVAFGLISKESTLPEATPSLFQAAAKAVLAGTEKLQEDLNDAGILRRALYLEAILCLTLGEIHAVENPKGALALTLRGLDMFRTWCIGN